MKVVIFSSELDLPYARECRKHLADKFSINARIEAGLPSDPKLLGLMGDGTAREMCRAMIAACENENDVVAKIDADTKLFQLGADWLSLADTANGARGYFVGLPRAICLTFAASRKHLEETYTLLKKTKGNGCAGCLICQALKRTGAGISISRGVWNTGQDGLSENTPQDTHLLTLPTRSLDSIRQKQMEHFWATNH